MGAWIRSKYNLICLLLLLLAAVEAVQITPIEFGEEVLRNNKTYVRPFRKANQGLVKLATVTYPLTGHEPDWNGQETVRDYVASATNSVDTTMKNFVTQLAQLNAGSEEKPLTGPALQVTSTFMQLRNALNSYLEARIAVDSSIWSFEIKRPAVPKETYIWVLIERLWETVSECCLPTTENGDDKSYEWIFNGIYDEEAGLWTMKPEDTGLRIQILGAMMSGLSSLKTPAKELIDDIRAISIENKFPTSTYESLPKIVDDLEVIIQAFVTSLWAIRLGMSGLHIEFRHRFEKED
ncbi:hypothetical protein TWF225_006974 [Orbilia oligospora]|uniref:Uncharacterized protein n=1 Tax=Orbilia oligospora TaxID=2813651 RepID=A0A7C8TZW9_ORBOL|nr:hypothetical protein TWF751_008290 [Orbilia oligospora]KAF3194431.1 hypothetical protein TWF225_006974 [Orbilia oligospora]KAF3242703.1 hypothetical protein TWF128_010439 [Orbilia oligospora]KAF3264182.1 hypothetical protein TWF217_003334 [Orbilia oligospora]TGJ68602.1 hypothetical protein EYR41_007645 [Orbilia oligospora]